MFLSPHSHPLARPGLLMTVDKTEGRATNQNSQMEEMGHRINQERRLLHLPPNHPENPQEWKASV